MRTIRAILVSIDSSPLTFKGKKGVRDCNCQVYQYSFLPDYLKKEENKVYAILTHTQIICLKLEYIGEMSTNFLKN